MQFRGFRKISRLSREMIITEKLDGTNAQVCVVLSCMLSDKQCEKSLITVAGPDGLAYTIFAGSGTRWITPEDDNYGFAQWVFENANELVKLGPGSHFGEWWGQGIQRRYDLKEKRFSLFNVSKWAESRPSCCHVVPTLYRGEFDTEAADTYLNQLWAFGSVAAPGFMRPEGIVVYHTASGQLFKKTLEKDNEPKSKSLNSK